MTRSSQYKLIKMDTATEKAIEQKVDSNFVRIHPDKEDFDIFRTINQIFRHIKQSLKKN